MTSAATQSDMGIGLGLLFGLLAVGAAVLTTVTGYLSAVSHEGSGVATLFQLTSGWSFATAMATATLAIAAIHLYDA